MLVVKAYVNAEQIDEIHIQRVSEKDGIGTYAVRKPEGCGKAIVHRMRDGYRPLLMSVLEYLEAEKQAKEKP